MRLEKIISRSRVIDLRSLDLEGALEELLAVSVAKFPDLKRDVLLKGLLARESTMTTYLGLGVALPHVRVKMPRLSNVKPAARTLLTSTLPPKKLSNMPPLWRRAGAPRWR